MENKAMSGYWEIGQRCQAHPSGTSKFRAANIQTGAKLDYSSFGHFERLKILKAGCLEFGCRSRRVFPAAESRKDEWRPGSCFTPAGAKKAKFFYIFCLRDSAETI
jgi:hypothetical protein